MTSKTPPAPQMSYSRLIVFLALAIIASLASQIAANHYLASHPQHHRAR